jgi:hypothetical protein
VRSTESGCAPQYRRKGHRIDATEAFCACRSQVARQPVPADDRRAADVGLERKVQSHDRTARRLIDSSDACGQLYWEPAKFDSAGFSVLRPDRLGRFEGGD